MTDHQPVMDAAAIEHLLVVEFPQLFAGDRAYWVEAVGPLWARVRLDVDDRHLRPGGTVSGPTLFALADLAIYVALLAQLGPVVGTVTVSMTLNFMRKPPAGRPIFATCRLLKLGRRLAVGEVALTGEGSEELLAHATGTYSIPDRAREVVS